jgi:hypothetical protein
VLWHAQAVKVTIMLADAAQVAEGKLFVLGGGWSFTGPAPSPSALAILVEVPWDRTNASLHFVVELLDSDGQAVIAGEEGQPIVVAGDIEAGRPPGTPPGSPIAVPLAINLGPLPLAPGGRFEWRFSLDGETRDDWRVTFNTRAVA